MALVLRAVKSVSREVRVTVTAAFVVLIGAMMLLLGRRDLAARRWSLPLGLVAVVLGFGYYALQIHTTGQRIRDVADLGLGAAALLTMGALISPALVANRSSIAERSTTQGPLSGDEEPAFLSRGFRTLTGSSQGFMLPTNDVVFEASGIMAQSPAREGSTERAPLSFTTPGPLHSIREEQPPASLFIRFTDFMRRVEPKARAGGKTESERLVICEGPCSQYQVKTSAFWLTGAQHLLKGSTTQSDMVAEFIATHVARALVPDGPQGFITVDDDGAGNVKLKAVSKYMPAGDILDRLYESVTGEKAIFPLSKQKHPVADLRQASTSVSKIMRISEPAQEDQPSSMPEHTPGVVARAGPGDLILDKRSIARALWLSMILGDHDCHTGNMWAFTGEGEGGLGRRGTVVRFDFGHALNDFIDGTYEEAQVPPIHDFLTRVKLKQYYGLTKLRRDFRGVCLDDAFISALDLTDDDVRRLQEKVREAASQAMETLDVIRTSSSQAAAAVNDALEAIRRNLGNMDVAEFVCKNIADCPLIAKLARLQKAIKERRTEDATSLRESLHIDPSTPVLWLYDEAIHSQKEKVSRLTVDSLYRLYGSRSRSSPTGAPAMGTPAMGTPSSVQAAATETPGETATRGDGVRRRIPFNAEAGAAAGAASASGLSSGSESSGVLI